MSDKVKNMRKLKLFIGVAVITATLTNANGQNWLTNGLVAHYPFAGSAVDSSGNGNNGTILRGNFVTDRFGNSSNALQNPAPVPSWGWAVDTHVGNQYSSAFTLSVWFQISKSSDTILITYGSIGYIDPYISAGGTTNDQGRTDFRLFSSGTLLTCSNSPVNDSKWHSVVATLTNGVASFYFDGTLAKQASNAVPLSISGQSWKLAPGASTIDDVRIYDRALTANEVAQLYAIESIPVVNFVKAFTLDYQNLRLGSNYQLQATSDMKTWTNWGAPFMATSTTFTNSDYHRIDDWSKLFFRLQQQ